jgi:ribulose-5-phosphate 4-epimerase/fuculose-1-phosphate aldolase
MVDPNELKVLWSQVCTRLNEKGLLDAPDATISVRIPGSNDAWYGAKRAQAPERVQWRGAQILAEGLRLHAAIYSSRPDVGAIAYGGGPYGLRLKDFGGRMPGVFDEQVRHLGCMGHPARRIDDLCGALRAGGNVTLVNGVPVSLGTTAARMAMNAELFEKCAKAFILASATGGRVKALPWVVRHVANGRLMKDEKRARESFSRGELPEEARGY